MRPDFTPAVWRALNEASRWTDCSDDAPLNLPQVLLGLLAQSECRAAALLFEHGIDAAAIRHQWPALHQIDNPPENRASDFSPPLHAAIAEAGSRLDELPQPLSLATEHLLLGMLAGPSEVAAWLAEHGMTIDDLQARIFRWEGVEQGPLEMNAESTGNAECGMWNAECKRPDSNTSAFRIPHSALLRLLDASANRAREGLRVVEDYVRFVLDDVHLTGRLKELRHRLAAALAPLPLSDLLSSRDTLSDVGTQLTTVGEQYRADLTAVVTANFKRLQESLRSLEEHSKTLDPEMARQLETLRYDAYTLERAIGVTSDSLARLQHARLYVLIDGRQSLADFEEFASSLIAAGVHVLQLRDKHLADRDLLVRARRLRELTRATQTLFIMNDRPDLAALSDADGVHIGQEELSVKDARAIVGPRALIGVSTHSIEQARQAVVDGGNYIGVGPTFPSSTKHFDAFTGLELLRAVSAEIRLPAFAIGGITLDNLPEVLSTGIRRIAVSGAICASRRPATAAEQFLQTLDETTKDTNHTKSGYIESASPSRECSKND